nr:small multi-drug export protein [Gammaproteobacteria bacterium]
ALSWLWSPTLSQVLVAIAAMNILFGRAAGLSFGYAAGLDHGVVVPVNMIVETILVLLFYPLFVFSWRHLVEIRGLTKLIKRTTTAAEANREKIRKYGMIGLLAFVWLPFWMTGPVVGCAIGYLLGLRTWLNLTVVLAGTYLAIGGWALVLRELHVRVAEYSVFGPMALLALIILIAVVGYLLHKAHRESGPGEGGD